MTEMRTTVPQPKPCGWCGTGIYHSGQCPRVKALEYHPDGSLKRVEFHESKPEQLVVIEHTVGAGHWIGHPS